MPVGMSEIASVPTSTTTAEAKKTGDSKPVKLRSACNSCFAAKVRCDGDKNGCKRCVEKHLVCTYSESMVGKVVGKRRKRPLPEATGNESEATQWNITVGPTTLPSPAPTTFTNASEQYAKRACISNDWTSFIQYDDRSPVDYSEYEEQYLDFSQADESSTSDQISFATHHGLPTPSISPPEMEFLLPADAAVETFPQSSSKAHQSNQYPTSLLTPASSIYQRSIVVEDDETICIKLLAHLKLFSIQSDHSFHMTLSLIKKIIAVLKRLLGSRSIRTDYTCQLLMTGIVMHLVAFCERLLLPSLQSPNQTPAQEFVNESYQPDDNIEQDLDPRSVAKTAVHESATLCTCVGDLLKRRPLNGFQVLGRHETAHVEVDIRLRRVIASLS